MKKLLAAATTVGSAVACGDLPEFALVSGGASAIDQQCDGTTGYILIEQDPALSYSIGSTVLTSAKTAMKPGTYTVTAVVTDPAHAYDGTPSWTLTVAATSAICGDLTTLALTGGVAGIAYLSLAALLLMVGGFVVLRARARRAA